MWHNTEEKWEEEVACCQEHRELSDEFAGGALKSMGMSRCSREPPQEGQTGWGRSHVCRKDSDRARHS